MKKQKLSDKKHYELLSSFTYVITDNNKQKRSLRCQTTRFVNSADYIFWSFGTIEFVYRYFINRVLLKPVLGGMATVENFITGHEQTQLNRVCYFHFFDVFLAFKGSNYLELIYFHCRCYAVWRP